MTIHPFPLPEPDNPVTDNPWQALRRFTDARIALGRAGVSLPTRELLAFQLDHARARDAVHLALDTDGLQRQLATAGLDNLCLHSAAADRHTYLQRPDLGRRLDTASAARLDDGCRQQGGPARFDLAIVIADGLSALAIQQHAVPLLLALGRRLAAEEWRLAPIVLVRQGRVAVGDEVGARLGADNLVMLIGERPGLSSPDSLGIYLTHGPRVGLTDASRNCISNVRPAGMSHESAAYRLHYLLTEARRRGISGVALKDETESDDRRALAGSNFLLAPPEQS